MKNLILLFILLCCTTRSMAQDSNFSVNLSYPLPLADNSFKDYTGIADLGVQYAFFESGKWQFGASLNGAYFKQSRGFTNPSFTVDQNIFLVQPKVFATLKIGQDEKFRPFMGLGYTLALYSIRFDVANGPPDENESKGGFTLNGGATIDVGSQLFIIGQLEYTAFSIANQGINIAFSDNFVIAKLGLGYRF